MHSIKSAPSAGEGFTKPDECNLSDSLEMLKKYIFKTFSSKALLFKIGEVCVLLMHSSSGKDGSVMCGPLCCLASTVVRDVGTSHQTQRVFFGGRVQGEGDRIWDMQFPVVVYSCGLACLFVLKQKHN